MYRGYSAKMRCVALPFSLIKTTAGLTSNLPPICKRGHVGKDVSYVLIDYLVPLRPFSTTIGDFVNQLHLVAPPEDISR